MVMLLFVRHGKDNFYKRIESLQSIPFEVGSGFEVDTIDAWLQGLRWGEQMFAAAIGVGNGFVDGRPGAVRHEGESDRNCCGRTSKRGVANVCCDSHAYSYSTPHLQ